ncbi:MAG: efflux RND transporter periplasmic adaptor subunit, partial [Balneolaceae bacterium]
MRQILFIGLSVTTFFLLSCSSESSEERQEFGGQGGPGGGQGTSVEVTPVETDIISDQIRSYGTIQAQDVVSVTPQVSDRVAEILVDLGDEVRQGQLMARIRDVSFRDDVEQAEAQIRQARTALVRDSTQFVRQQSLLERDLISQSEYDEFRAAYLSSRAQYESARAALTQSREDLENTEIRSPVEGVVLERMISVGDVATTGQVAFEVANLVGYETRVFLPRQDWEEVQVGQEVAFSLSSRSEEHA